jgi:hypothetical protein
MLDRIRVAVGALRLDQADQRVVGVFEPVDQVGAGGGRDRRDGPAVPDPDHDVVRDAAPALGEPLLLCDRCELLVVPAGVRARAVGGGSQGRGRLVVLLQEALARRLGVAAECTFPRQQRVEHRAGGFALGELARADRTLGGCRRPRDSGHAGDERRQDRRKPQQMRHQAP